MPEKMKTYGDILRCVPRRSFDFEIDPETKRVIVLRPKYVSKIGRTIMMPLLKKKNFRIKLDELGSHVWQNCDGRNSVEKIVAVLEKTFGEKQEQLMERSVKFIMELEKQKFIVLQ